MKKSKIVFAVIAIFSGICFTGCSGCNKENNNTEEVTQAPGLGEGEGGGKSNDITESREFSVVINENEMIYNGTSYNNAQSLIDQILSEVQEGVHPIVVLHTDSAITDTAQDLKNKLDKNEIEWEEK